MTTTLILLAAMMTGADPPRARHKLGMIPPTEEQYQKALHKGLDYRKYIKGPKQVLPQQVDLTGMLPRPYRTGQQDQDCVGWSMAYAAKSYYEAVELNRKPSDDQAVFSPMFIYSQRSNRDAEGEKRDGMNPLEALQILEQKGCATWEMMPYDKESVNDPPTEQIVLKSYPYQIANHFVLPPTADAIKAMLALKKVVVLGIAVTPAFEHLLAGEVLATHDADEIRGYHAICAVGYDNSRKAIRLMNSWGDQWCDGGFCWISYDLFASEEPLNKRFCGRAFAFAEAPTVTFVPQVQHTSEGDSWKLEVTGSPEALKDLATVAYALPDPFKPSVLIKSDPDTQFALTSSELNPSTSTSVVPIVAILYTRTNFQLARSVIVPCGNGSGLRPHGPGDGGTVIIPELLGSSPDFAAMRLSRLGLHVKISKVHKALPGSDIARGHVARQYPEARTKGARGGTVVLFVAD